MNPHNFSIYACGICGVLMVVGSIWLLKTGVITLSAAAKDGILSMEIADKVKVSTTYPALGLFLIGLFFIGLGVWFSKGDVVMPLNRPLAIVGKIKGIEDSSLVTVTVEPDQYKSAYSFGADTNGRLNKILPDIKQFTVRIAANGYKPQQYTATLNVDDAVEEPQRRRLDVPDDVKFTKISSGAITVAAPPVPGPIQPTPVGTNLEPFRAAATEPAPLPSDANPQSSPKP